MELRVQDRQAGANCGPWVAVMAGMVQLWDCYRQAREGGSWASLQEGVQNIVTVRGLEDRNQGPTSSNGNTEYIWGYRRYMRGHVRLRACPGKYGERETFAANRLQQTGKAKRKMEELGENSQQGRDKGFALEHNSAKTKRKAGALGKSAQQGRDCPLSTSDAADE